MAETLDNPRQAAAIDAALARLDAADTAAKCNALTGGCLRGEDAMKVARLVALSAIRAPGRRVVVAGIAGECSGPVLTMTFCGDLARIEIPNDLEF